jgi:hypothetical protein
LMRLQFTAGCENSVLLWARTMIPDRAIVDAGIEEEKSSRSVAQPGSALAWGARGPEFKSRRSDQSNQALTSYRRRLEIHGVQLSVMLDDCIRDYLNALSSDQHGPVVSASYGAGRRRASIHV